MEISYLQVGQSLCSDLQALRMMHPYVIDTSVIYNLTGVRRRKTKLAVLAQNFLGQSIQQDGKLGHSPIEDAQAAMLERGLKSLCGIDNNRQIPILGTL